MSDILDETVADKIVIKNLLKEIKKLRNTHQMEQKLLLDVNGDLYIASTYQLVSETTIDDDIVAAQKQIAELEEMRALADKLQAQTSAPATEEAPAPAPVEAPAPVAEAPVAPAPELAASTDNITTPVEQPQPQVEQPVAAEPVAEQPQVNVVPQPVVLQ